MAKPILLPQVGQDIEKAVLVKWCVNENDEIKKGDIVALVESDKATLEVESFEEGVLLKKLYQDGEEAIVLQPIAYVGRPGEVLEQKPEKSAPAAPAAERAVAAKEASAEGDLEKIGVSPSARRIAREHNIDISVIRGTGPNGRIVKEDVLAVIESSRSADMPSADSAGDRVVTFSRMRQAIADRLTYSKQNIPHFYLTIEVDMTRAVNWRKERNDSAKEKITFNDMVIKAVASALAKFGNLNAHVQKDRVTLKKHIHIGSAVAVEDGLVVPVIPDADRKGLEEISQLSRQNADGARKGIMKAQSEGTFTVSNLGMHAIAGFLPIINPPEAAILGVGSIQGRPVVREDGSIAVSQVMTLSLACDHRAVNGSEGAAFLKEVKIILEELKFD